MPSDMRERPRQRFAPRFNEVKYNRAMARSQYTRRKFDHTREGGWIANRSNSFGGVPAIRSKMLSSVKRAC